MYIIYNNFIQQCYKQYLTKNYKAIDICSMIKVSKIDTRRARPNLSWWIIDLNWLTDMFVISVLTVESWLFQVYAALKELNFGTIKVLLFYFLTDVNDYHEQIQIERTNMMDSIFLNI